jgi:3-keto-5-aminohexanoate cleavage enzyme
MAMSKVIVTAALNGSFPTRQHTPYVPITPEEISEEAYRSYNAGAAIVHIHARAVDGTPTSDSEIYAKIDRLIRDRCNVIINHTTSGGKGKWNASERLRSIRNREHVQIASLNTGHIQKFPARIEDLSSSTGMINPLPEIVQFAREMLEGGIKPESEIYDVSMLNTVKFLSDHNLLRPPIMIQFVMGLGGQCIDASPKNLLHLVETLTLNNLEAFWSVCAAGRFEFPTITMGLLLGGNIRVGIEDNLYLKKGVLAKSNAELVERAIRLINELELEIATPDEAKSLLGIKPF